MAEVVQVRPRASLRSGPRVGEARSCWLRRWLTTGCSCASTSRWGRTRASCRPRERDSGGRLLGVVSESSCSKRIHTIGQHSNVCGSSLLIGPSMCSSSTATTHTRALEATTKCTALSSVTAASSRSTTSFPSGVRLGGVPRYWRELKPPDAQELVQDWGQDTTASVSSDTARPARALADLSSSNRASRKSSATSSEGALRADSPWAAAYPRDPVTAKASVSPAGAGSPRPRATAASGAVLRGCELCGCPRPRSAGAVAGRRCHEVRSI